MSPSGGRGGCLSKWVIHGRPRAAPGWGSKATSSVTSTMRGYVGPVATVVTRRASSLQHTGATSSSSSAGILCTASMGDPGHRPRWCRGSCRAAIQRLTGGEPAGDLKHSVAPSRGRGETRNSSCAVCRMAQVRRFTLARGLQALASARSGSSTAKCSRLVRYTRTKTLRGPPGTPPTRSRAPDRTSPASGLHEASSAGRGSLAGGARRWRAGWWRMATSMT